MLGKILVGCGIALSIFACGGGGASDDRPALGEDDVTSGGVKFRVPLLDEESHLPLSRHNDALRAKGLETFPDTVDVAPRNLEKDWEKWFDVLDRANAALGTKMDLVRNANPIEFGSALCYIGNARSVAKTMRALNDSVFAEFITVYRWKFKDESHLTDAWASFGEPENASKYPAAFGEFKGSGEDVMLAVTAQDDGIDGEFFAVRIPKCP
jgi:hypothetical protein